MSSRFNIVNLLVAFAFFLTAAAHAEARPNSYPGGIDKLLGAFAHGAVTEATSNPDEMILTMVVAINQAKDQGKNVENVIYSKAFNGPIDNPTPWKRRGGEAQFERAVEIMTPLHDKYVANEDVLPEHLQQYEDIYHFDSRPHLKDFGDFRGQKGNTCYYSKVKTGKVVDRCTAGAANLKRLYAQEGKTKKAQYASNKKHKNAAVASGKRNGKTALVARNDNKAEKSVSGARDLRVASR